MAIKKKKKIYEMTLDDMGAMGFKAVSFVDDPAIEKNFIHLSQMREQVKLSANEERRIVFGPLLIPEIEILRIDPQTQEEFYIKFSAKTIEQMAYRMMKQGLQKQATVMHSIPVDSSCIVETWIKEGPQDKSVHLGFDVPVGTHMIGCHIAESDTQLWEMIKDGTLRGFSIEALMQDVEVQMFADLESELLSEIDELINEHL